MSFDPFGGMFDFNRDGMTDSFEMATGLFMLRELEKSLRQQESEFSVSGGFGDDDGEDEDDEDGLSESAPVVYAVGDTVAGDLMRDWYDEAEFHALGGDYRKQDEYFIPDRGQTWLEAAQEFCERFEGIHLQATPGSKYKYTFVRPVVEAADEETNNFREIGSIDENTQCFFLSTVFVPANERALNWSMAGNTGNYTGSDPDVPSGAYEYSRCGYAHRVPDGWRCEIVGTGW